MGRLPPVQNETARRMDGFGVKGETSRETGSRAGLAAFSIDWDSAEDGRT